MVLCKYHKSFSKCNQVFGRIRALPVDRRRCPFVLEASAYLRQQLNRFMSLDEVVGENESARRFPIHGAK